MKNLITTINLFQRRQNRELKPCKFRINNRYEIHDKAVKGEPVRVRNIRGTWAGEFETSAEAWAFVVKRLRDGAVLSYDA